MVNFGQLFVRYGETVKDKLNPAGLDSLISASSPIWLNSCFKLCIARTLSRSIYGSIFVSSLSSPSANLIIAQKAGDQLVKTLGKKSFIVMPLGIDEE